MPPSFVYFVDVGRIETEVNMNGVTGWGGVIPSKTTRADDTASDPPDAARVPDVVKVELSYTTPLRFSQMSESTQAVLATAAAPGKDTVSLGVQSSGDSESSVSKGSESDAIKGFSPMRLENYLKRKLGQEDPIKFTQVVKAKKRQ